MQVLAGNFGMQIHKDEREVLRSQMHGVDRIIWGLQRF